MATVGSLGPLSTTGGMVPIHQISDSAGGTIPWLVTSPSHNIHTSPFTITTPACTSLKRDHGTMAAIFGASTPSNKHSEVVVGDVLGVGLQVLDFTMSYLPTSVPYHVPFGTHQTQHSMSVSSGGNMPSPNSALMATVDVTNDPIAKAVMDNVLGRLPTKKPRVTVRCDVCNLEFSSQTVLDSHLAGSKHQRKVKSAELMRTLEETETGFERDEVSGVIRCIICDVTVNSPQLLATHIAGNKHKQRAAKRAGDTSNTGPPAKKMCTGGGTTEQQYDSGTSMNAASTNGGSNTHTGTYDNYNSSGNTDGGTGHTYDNYNSTGNTDGTGNGDTAAAGDNKVKTESTLEIPDCVTKLEETKGGGKYLCNPCQAHCNSEQQLSQHLSSRKHLDKINGRKPKGAGWRGGRGRRGMAGFRGGLGSASAASGSYDSRGAAHTYTQPLSSTFVSEGTLM